MASRALGALSRRPVIRPIRAVSRTVRLSWLGTGSKSSRRHPSLRSLRPTSDTQLPAERLTGDTASLDGPTACPDSGDKVAVPKPGALFAQRRVSTVQHRVGAVHLATSRQNERRHELSHANYKRPVDLCEPVFSFFDFLLPILISICISL